MPLYKCTFRDKFEKRLTQKLDMETTEQAIEYLKTYGHVVIRVKKASIFDMEITRSATAKDISTFCRQFSYMANSGVQVVEALDMIRGQTKNKRIQRALNLICADVRKGIPLSGGLKKHKEFPRLLVNMTYVGELSGDLGNVYTSMADYYDREYRRSDEIRGALGYPLAVSIILIGVIAVAIVYLVPNYVSIYAGNTIELPLATKLLVWLSNFLTNNLMSLIAFITAIFFSFSTFLKTKNGKHIMGVIKLNAPLYGKIYKKSVNATFADVMGILLNASYPVTEAISTVKHILDNPSIDKSFDNMISDVESGMGLSQAMLPLDFFERSLCGMIRIGEESGRLVHALDNCATYLNAELNSMISKFGKLIEPTIILILGLLLGFVMLAIMLPAFNLGNVL